MLHLVGGVGLLLVLAGEAGIDAIEVDGFAGLDQKVLAVVHSRSFPREDRPARRGNDSFLYVRYRCLRSSNGCARRAASRSVRWPRQRGSRGRPWARSKMGACSRASASPLRSRACSARPSKNCLVPRPSPRRRTFEHVAREYTSSSRCRWAFRRSTSPDATLQPGCLRAMRCCGSANCACVWLPMTNRAALEELRRGRVHAAVVHGTSMKGGDYERFELATTEEGWLLARSNPLRLRGAADLARKGVRLVNRPVGAGARTLLDEQLRRAHIDPQRVHGYAREVAGQLDAGRAIAQGFADIAVGMASIARIFATRFHSAARGALHVARPPSRGARARGACAARRPALAAVSSRRRSARCLRRAQNRRTDRMNRREVLGVTLGLPAPRGLATRSRKS